MGRELQKKKNKSSIAKVRQKPKSKKKLIPNPIIAANWDKKQTLSQNYRRLGLSSRINAATGGTEKSTSATYDDKSLSTLDTAPTNHDRLAIQPRPSATELPTEVRIERDPETGRILRVLDEPTAPNPLNDPLNALEDEEEEADEWQGFQDSHAALGHLGSRHTDSDVVRRLEEQAASGVRKAPRKQSQREVEWIERLVAQHGQDYKGMFRDHKLNPMQQSEGELKARVGKYLASKAKAA